MINHDVTQLSKDIQKRYGSTTDNAHDVAAKMIGIQPALSDALNDISTLIYRLSIQKSDDGTLKNSERKLLKSISNDFRRYAEEIRKIGPSNDTFPVIWVFQGILSSSRRIHDTGTLDKFPRWETDGEPLLKLVSEASYSELSKLSDSGKH